jgi:mxaJ protein
MTIGVQSIGDDASSPPAAALLKRGLGQNLHAYTFHGHYSDPNSAAEIVSDVAAGRLGTAVLWGPFAGYFAARQAPPLSVTMVQPKPSDLQMFFDIAMAVRKDDSTLLAALNDQIDLHRIEIDATLDSFGIPHLPQSSAAKVDP